MALHTIEHVKDILTQTLESGESLQEFCYALGGFFGGRAIGLTNRRLIIVKLGLFSGKAKDVQGVARSDIADAHYDENKLSFTMNDGTVLKFTMMATAGLDGNKNYDCAKKLFAAVAKS